MSTVGKPRAKRKRAHNPEIQRFKRVARNLRLPWADVCQQRDQLRALELEQRAHEDLARQTGWRYFVAMNGWSKTQLPFWRNGFQRVFRGRMARGKDFTSIPRYDEIADGVREHCPELREWDTNDIFDLLLSEYPPLHPIELHYSNAIALLCRGLLTVDMPGADCDFDTF